MTEQLRSSTYISTPRVLVALPTVRHANRQLRARDSQFTVENWKAQSDECSDERRRKYESDVLLRAQSAPTYYLD